MDPRNHIQQETAGLQVVMPINMPNPTPQLGITHGYIPSTSQLLGMSLQLRVPGSHIFAEPESYEIESEQYTKQAKPL